MLLHLIFIHGENAFIAKLFGNNMRMKNKRFIILSIFALLLLATAVPFFTACTAKPVSQQKLADSCIRIHIRANSNSQTDQNVKLAVRDNITVFLQDALANCTTKADAQNILKKESPTLIKIANATLKANGFLYDTSIKMGKEYFPDRVYDGYEFPAGSYDAVIINLGSGKGDNWWCVAFPPLCFVPDSKQGEKVVYKSWIKEMLDDIFGK